MQRSSHTAKLLTIYKRMDSEERSQSEDSICDKTPADLHQNSIETQGETSLVKIFVGSLKILEDLQEDPNADP